MSMCVFMRARVRGRALHITYCFPGGGPGDANDIGPSNVNWQYDQTDTDAGNGKFCLQSEFVYKRKAISVFSGLNGVKKTLPAFHYPYTDINLRYAECVE
jgi:hypothetical protein